MGGSVGSSLVELTTGTVLVVTGSVGKGSVEGTGVVSGIYCAVVGGGVTTEAERSKSELMSTFFGRYLIHFMDTDLNKYTSILYMSSILPLVVSSLEVVA